ncbi:MAG: S1 RNA-binding domain-containing protein [Anaerolineae bacterium]
MSGRDSSHIDLEVLRVGTEVKGHVVKIGKIGAIINVGGYPGLLHISELTSPKARHLPLLHEGDEVTAWVSEVDKEKKRMLLTLVKPPDRPIGSLQVGTIVHGKVVRLTKFGAFVDIGSEKDGLVHVSELAHTRVGDPSEVVAVGDEIDVKVLAIDREKGQISLSLKAVTPEPRRERREPEAVGVQQPLTSMQHAWQEAFDEQSRRDRPPKKRRRERERGMPRGEERDDLFLRTIRYRS